MIDMFRRLFGPEQKQISVDTMGDISAQRNNDNYVEERVSGTPSAEHPLPAMPSHSRKSRSSASTAGERALSS